MVYRLPADRQGCSLDYPRADRFEHGGARFEVTLQCVFEDKLRRRFARNPSGAATLTPTLSQRERARTTSYSSSRFRGGKALKLEL